MADSMAWLARLLIRMTFSVASGCDTTKLHRMVPESHPPSEFWLSNVYFGVGWRSALATKRRSWPCNRARFSGPKRRSCFSPAGRDSRVGSA